MLKKQKLHHLQPSTTKLPEVDNVARALKNFNQKVNP